MIGFCIVLDCTRIPCRKLSVKERFDSTLAGEDVIMRQLLKGVLIMFMILEHKEKKEVTVFVFGDISLEAEKAATNTQWYQSAIEPYIAQGFSINHVVYPDVAALPTEEAKELYHLTFKCKALLDSLCDITPEMIYAALVGMLKYKVQGLSKAELKTILLDGAEEVEDWD